SQALAQATTFAPRVRTCTLHTRNEDDYAELLRRGCRSRARRRQSAGSPRETAMKLSRGVARFNKRVTKRIQGLYAWLVPPWAVILHRGRRSGRQYRTPLFAFRRGRILVIALLYGEESEWLRNLRAGGGHVIRGGRTFVVGAPEVVASREAGS